MFLGFEIGMILLGVYALVTGKLPLTTHKVVVAPLSRQLAKVLLAPIPLAYLAHGYVHLQFVQHRLPVGNSSQFTWTMIGVEAAITLICFAIVYTIGWFNAVDACAADPRETDVMLPT